MDLRSTFSVRAHKGLSGRLRVALRRAAHVCYVYAPLSLRWKERCAGLVYRATGWIFRGDPNYESWKRKGNIRHLAVESRPVGDAEFDEVLASINFPEVADPLVSIVIAAGGDARRVLACLRSIQTHMPIVSCEVLVCVHGPVDRDMLRLRDIAGVRFLTDGARASRDVPWRGCYLHLLDGATEVMAGWLDRMVDLFWRETDCGLVGSMLVGPDGRLQHAGGIVWQDAVPYDAGRSLSPAMSEFQYVRDVDYCSRDSVLIPAALFEALQDGGTCRVSDGWADIELAFRVRAHGRRVLYQPESVVVRHEVPPVPAQAVSAQREFLQRWTQTLADEHAAAGAQEACASNRPVRRAMILVVDHRLPQPDRDAGSRSMWCILRTLVRMGLVVKFWPQDEAYDPDYARPLQQAGIEVIAGNPAGTSFAEWLEAHCRCLKYVLLSRPAVASEFLDRVRQGSDAKILFYGHDIHHLRLMGEYEVTRAETARREAAGFRRLEHALWRQADVVYYPSADETRQVLATVPGARAHTLPLYFFDELPQVGGPGGRAGILFVAGFGHTPNVDAAKWLVERILPLLRTVASGEVPVWLVGSNPLDEVKALAGPGVTVTGYVPEERLLAFYRTTRVAVVPLRFGAGMKGKVLEALHHGVPLVTTPVGAQGLEGVDSVAVVSSDEHVLAERIGHLLRDDDAWREASRRQIEYMAGRFSPQAMEKALRWGLDAAEQQLKGGSK